VGGVSEFDVAVKRAPNRASVRGCKRYVAELRKLFVGSAGLDLVARVRLRVDWQAGSPESYSTMRNATHGARAEALDDALPVADLPGRAVDSCSVRNR
jgi:hypothetical protein